MAGRGAAACESLVGFVGDDAGECNMAIVGSETPDGLDHAAGGVTLRRSLSLWHALLYGLGITIGAGIYVLIGPMAAAAAYSAPFAILFAALLMGLSAASFAELATRMPVAAGEAAYVAEGLRVRSLGTAIGLLVAAINITTSATISIGSAEYIRVFIGAPELLVIAVVVVAMGAIAAWGIVESITFAGIMTVVEVGGLLFIAAVGFAYEPATADSISKIVPALTSPAIWVGIVSAGMLAVFAFIGFEGIVNLAEEMRDPRRDLPRAILLTLAITTVLYIAVMWVSLAALGPDTLGSTKAPLAGVFEKLTGWPPTVMAAIAIVATLNGIIASIILAARICYGMAKRGDIPEIFARLSPRTRTPLIGTTLITGIVLVLALAVPLEGLADISSQMTLVMFGTVNLALVAIKWRETSPPAGIFVTPMAVPVAGFIATLAFLAADIVL